jgi:hypothetical protein
MLRRNQDCHRLDRLKKPTTKKDETWDHSVPYSVHELERCPGGGE